MVTYRYIYIYIYIHVYIYVYTDDASLCTYWSHSGQEQSYESENDNNLPLTLLDRLKSNMEGADFETIVYLYIYIHIWRCLFGICEGIVSWE